MGKIVLIVFALFLSSISFANDLQSYGASVIEKVSSVVQSKESRQKKEVKLYKIIDENANLQYAAKYVIGSVWRDLTLEQRKIYFDLYKKFLLKRYSYLLIEILNNAKITVLNSKSDNEIEFEIFDKVQGSKSYGKLLIENPSSGKYMIRDIIVEEVSLLSAQRREFADEIQKNGFDNFLLYLQKL